MNIFYSPNTKHSMFLMNYMVPGDDNSCSYGRHGPLLKYYVYESANILFMSTEFNLIWRAVATQPTSSSHIWHMCKQTFEWERGIAEQANGFGPIIGEFEIFPSFGGHCAGARDGGGKYQQTSNLLIYSYSIYFTHLDTNQHHQPRCISMCCLW